VFYHNLSLAEEVLESTGFFPAELKAGGVKFNPLKAGFILRHRPASIVHFLPVPHYFINLRAVIVAQPIHGSVPYRP